ncbi:hypothetical protein FA13DRAFT_202380 [Coprinellus micaceus]|uniref:Uncharacterized protein n=1 Tax=Coprinellus micaceus TaxID=71717 RepID=A0A4Y7SFT1_COPMI|nr:hypothetical protein FA13DRAFT_202380 [Coprinellus micaceus]
MHPSCLLSNPIRPSIHLFPLAVSSCSFLFHTYELHTPPSFLFLLQAVILLQVVILLQIDWGNGLWSTGIASNQAVVTSAIHIPGYLPPRLSIPIQPTSDPSRGEERIG